jgi:hypothetical protein
VIEPLLRAAPAADLTVSDKVSAGRDGCPALRGCDLSKAGEIRILQTDYADAGSANRAK